jgi:hypothetical protein
MKITSPVATRIKGSLVIRVNDYNIGVLIIPMIA